MSLWYTAFSDVLLASDLRSDSGDAFTLDEGGSGARHPENANILLQ